MLWLIRVSFGKEDCFPLLFSPLELPYCAIIIQATLGMWLSWGIVCVCVFFSFPRSPIYSPFRGGNELPQELINLTLDTFGVLSCHGQDWAGAKRFVRPKYRPNFCPEWLMSRRHAGESRRSRAANTAQNKRSCWHVSRVCSVPVVVSCCNVNSMSKYLTHSHES